MHLCLAGSDGANVRENEEIVCKIPAVGPRGRIAFVSSSPAGDQILWIGKDGKPKDIRSVAGAVKRLSWSPDGRYLAYCFESESLGGVLAVYELDKGHEEIAPLKAVEDCAWAPDGRRIAVVKRRPVLGFQLAVYPVEKGVVKLSDRKEWSTRILLDSADGRIAGPSWSPDSRHLAFSRQGPAGWDICVCDIGAGKILPFTFDGADNVEPAWSPNGGSILFASRRSGVYYEIWKIRLVYK